MNGSSKIDINMKAKLADTHPYQDGKKPQSDFLFDLKDVRLAGIDHLNRIEVLIDTGYGTKQQWFEYDKELWERIENRFDELNMVNQLLDFMQSLFKDIPQESVKKPKDRKSFQERLDEAMKLSEEAKRKQS